MSEIFGNTTTTPLNPNAFSGGGSTDVDLSSKQDKFADVVIDKNTVTVDANKELRIKGIEASLSLGFDVAKLEADYEVYIHAKNGNVNVDGNRIRNLADPIYDTDAVNKQYMDAAIEERLSKFVNVAEVGQ